MLIAVLKLVLAFVIGYVIGSIPTGYIAVKLLKKEDVREYGSGSTGATNVKRVLGTKWFFIILLLDAIKGMLCVWLTMRLGFFSVYGLAAVLGALGAIFGHSWSIFLKGTGGKSVATGIGTLIALCPVVGLITTALWAGITFMSRMVSVGSIIAVLFAPLLMRLFGQIDYYFYYAVFLAGFIIYTHRENIQRLKEGKENKF